MANGKNGNASNLEQDDVTLAEGILSLPEHKRCGTPISVLRRLQKGGYLEFADGVGGSVQWVRPPGQRVMHLDVPGAGIRSRLVFA